MLRSPSACRGFLALLALVPLAAALAAAPAAAQDVPTLDGPRQELAQARAEIRRIVALPPRATERQGDADRLFARLRELVHELRGLAVDASSRGIEARRSLADARAQAATERQGLVEEGAADEAFEALEGRLRELERQALAADRHRDETFVLLREAKNLRRGFRGEVSEEALARDRRYLVDDLTSEAVLVWPNLQAFARYRLRSLSELGTRWRDWELLLGLLVGLAELFVVALLWWWVHRHLPRAVPRLLDLWARHDRRYFRFDFVPLEEPGRAAAAALVDLTAALALAGPLGARLPELGLALGIFVFVALYRLVLHATALAVARHPDVRPALVTVSRPAFRLLRRTVKGFTFWWLARWLVDWVAVEILAAVNLAEVLRQVFTVLFVLILAWAFFAWEPLLRRAARQRGLPAPLSQLMALPLALPRRGIGGLLTLPLRAPLRAGRGIVAAVLWLGAAAYGRLGRYRELWAWMAGRHTRGQEAVDDDTPPLPPEVLRELVRRDCREGCFIERPEVDEELDRCFERWREKSARGAVVVLGSEGAGKRTTIDAWCAKRAARGVAVVHRRLDERLTSADDARRFLGEALGLDDPADEPVSLAGQVDARHTGAVVVLEDLNFAYLRRVDGFAAIRFLLAVVSASRGPFWLASTHRAAWRYLGALGALVDTEAFHRAVLLPPLSEDELRRLVEERLEAADRELDFTSLLAPRTSHRRAGSRARQRAAGEYFRRLAWASEGNPSVALELVRGTLAPGHDDGLVRVRSFPAETALADLGDGELFLLAAIHSHRCLAEEELVEVTGMSRVEVRSTTKKLERRRLVVTRSKRFSLAPRYRPAVARSLRRRHFLHER